MKKLVILVSLLSVSCWASAKEAFSKCTIQELSLKKTNLKNNKDFVSLMKGKQMTILYGDTVKFFGPGIEPNNEVIRCAYEKGILVNPYVSCYVVPFFYDLASISAEVKDNGTFENTRDSGSSIKGYCK